MPPVLIAALLTCHNRREKTLECLKALKAQTSVEGPESRVEIAGAVAMTLHAQPSTTDNRLSTSRHSTPAFSLQVFLVDDGSTDGTAQAIRDFWPEVQIIQGNGRLYWCGGMRMAWAEAAKSNPDYFLLLNDDTILVSGALQKLLKLVPLPNSRVIAVGAICNPVTGEWTYGGSDCQTPFDPEKNSPRSCKTLNANVVLVPSAVFQEIGMFHPIYTHSMGDHDYGYLAHRRGIQLLETPRFVGQCTRNTITGTWRDASLPVAQRWKMILGPKGLPPFEWLTYCFRNTGWRWPVIFMSPYLKLVLRTQRSM